MNTVAIYYALIINAVTFIVYGIDKRKAQRGRWRVPESVLLLLAVVGGSVGALIGMSLWHHKTQHAKFKYGVPFILIVQIVVIAMLLMEG